MISVLHILQGISYGGASRALRALIKESHELRREITHALLPLVPQENDHHALQEVIQLGIRVFTPQNRNELCEVISNFDIIQVHWWNNPEVNALLLEDLPPTRMISWLHVGGHTPPHTIPKNLLHYFDVTVACSPYTYHAPQIQLLSSAFKKERVEMIYGSTDLKPLDDIQPASHEGFHIGYIGTVDFTKMHRNFIAMHSNLTIPDYKVFVAGGGIQETLRAEAKLFNVENKFTFLGYLKSIKEILPHIDVFGYPLCEETYAASEIILQEVMYAGIPAVVFPYGGVKELVTDSFNGLVVDSEEQYKEALQFLYHNPEERKRLGDNARHYARQTFGAKKMAQSFNRLYESLKSKQKTKKVWEFDCTAAPSNQAVTFNDLKSTPVTTTQGASLFIEFFDAENAEKYTVSRESSGVTTNFDIKKVLAMEQSIMNESELVKRGALQRYCKYYSNDCMLNFWQGLSKMSTRNYHDAIHYFERAMQLGFSHFRVYYYLGHCLLSIYNKDVALTFFKKVYQYMPEVIDEKLLKELSSSVS
jgi:glycosyltransferase involved in cell wall biosynthesis